MGTIKFTLKPGECRVVAGRRFCNRWKRNTAQSGQDYENGIRNPKRSWGKATCDAQDRYKAGVDKSFAQGQFHVGVRGAGTMKWLKEAMSKGPTRFAQGVYDGANDFERGFAPFRDAIKKTTLPMRYPKGDPRNIARCSTICTALGQAKAGEATTDRVTCPDR